MGKETFFTEADKLQEQGQNDAFGPINSSEFRTSSRHRCSEKSTAFAVADGHLVAVRQRPGDASSPLNLVLIPHGMKHPEVRCFVYINVDCESYFTQDGNFLNTEAQTHNDLISRIIKAHGENASAYTVLCTDNNADYDITDTERLMLSLSGNQPWPVREGDKIGRFNAGEIGFETVLKSMDFPFTLTDAKAANPAIAKEGDNDKEAGKRSLMFDDPAVLFPKHKDKFAYGNYVYLDIRIADGVPYRHAYEVPETTLTEDSNGWPIVRCLPQNNKVDFGIKVLNEDVTGAAVAVRGADSLAGNRDSAVVKWIKDLKAGNDGLSRISIGVEAPRRVQIRILPEANENSSADFVHKHPLDMVFGDYVENIEKVKKMAGIENGSGMRKMMRAQAAPQQETTGIYMLPIAQRETYINYYNDVKALLKADVIIEKFYDKDGILRTNRLYHATIEHIGKSKKKVQYPINNFVPDIIHNSENGSFFRRYNKVAPQNTIYKDIHGYLTYSHIKDWICTELFLCMTEEEADFFDNQFLEEKALWSFFSFDLIETTKIKVDTEFVTIGYIYDIILRTDKSKINIYNRPNFKFYTCNNVIFATEKYLETSDIELPKVYLYNEKDHFFNKELYLNGITPRGRQLRNACLTATMDYVNMLFGGDKKDGDYMKDFLYQYKFDIANKEGGASTEQSIEFIERHFDVSYAKNIISAINKRYVVFSTIYGGEHSVAIVGYTESGDYIFFDPEYNESEHQTNFIGLKTADPSCFTTTYNIPVIGIKEPQNN